MDKLAFAFICVYLLLMARPLQANAEKVLQNREDVFEFLESAFLAQVSLSEKGRNLDEVDGVLDPFFSEAYKKLFFKENIIVENEKYLTYGTDFAFFYIPFYTFSEKTKIVPMEDRIVIIEYFPKSAEGPVGYDSHYEGIELTMEQGSWKISSYWYDNVPEVMINKAYTSVKTIQSQILRQNGSIDVFLKPIEAFNPVFLLLNNTGNLVRTGKPLGIYFGNFGND